MTGFGARYARDLGPSSGPAAAGFLAVDLSQDRSPVKWVFFSRRGPLLSNDPHWSVFPDNFDERGDQLRIELGAGAITDLV